MIIDNHVHIGSSEKLPGRYLTLDQYHSLMIQSGITKAGVMTNLSNIIKHSDLNTMMLNSYMLSKFKNCFYPILVIDPKDMDTFEQVSLYHDCIYGLKYHPSISEMPISEKQMLPFLEAAQSYNFPILVHCGRHWRSNIEYVIKVAKEFKSITFIAAHLGGNVTDLVIKTIHMLSEDKSDNIFLDTSACKLPWLIEEAVRLLGSEKILFGSDEPFADLRIAKYCVELANISDSDKEQIFEENFQSVYGELKNV